MIDSTATISEFLAAAAAKQPTPGGGSVTALAGALAASMGAMVLAYSVGKKDLAAHAPANQQALHELSVACEMLQRLMTEDQQAFEALTEGKKRDLPEAELSRLTEICARVPQTIAATALAILEVANRIVSTSNKWLLSDLAVCGELAAATVRCSQHSVLVNLPEIRDERLRESLRADADQMVRRAVEQISRLIPAIRASQDGK